MPGVETEARVRFGEKDKAEGAWAGRRLLFLDDKPAFELSFWCGTCQYLFKRQCGADETVSLAATEGCLAEGIDGLVRPVEAGDYFAEEQVATWGPDSFWGLPEYPGTPAGSGGRSSRWSRLTRALRPVSRWREYPSFALRPTGAGA